MRVGVLALLFIGGHLLLLGLGHRVGVAGCSVSGRGLGFGQRSLGALQLLVTLGPFAGTHQHLAADLDDFLVVLGELPDAGDGVARLVQQAAASVRGRDRGLRRVSHPSAGAARVITHRNLISVQVHGAFGDRLVEVRDRLSFSRSKGGCVGGLGNIRCLHIHIQPRGRLERRRLVAGYFGDVLHQRFRGGGAGRKVRTLARLEGAVAEQARPAGRTERQRTEAAGQRHHAADFRQLLVARDRTHTAHHATGHHRSGRDRGANVGACDGAHCSQRGATGPYRSHRSDDADHGTERLGFQVLPVSRTAQSVANRHVRETLAVVPHRLGLFKCVHGVTSGT